MIRMYQKSTPSPRTDARVALVGSTDAQVAPVGSTDAVTKSSASSVEGGPLVAVVTVAIASAVSKLVALS